VPAEPDRFAGRPFGKYRLIRRLAKGGMGVVYLGEHVELGRKVAVKILAEEFSNLADIEARYRREGLPRRRTAVWPWILLGLAAVAAYVLFWWLI
jgi:serine/threonine protein kinase